MSAADIHFSASDGLQLFARDYGPSDASLTVLCLHGLTRNHKDFEPMIARLDPAYRFIAMDVRGRGRSAFDPDPGQYVPKRYVEDAATLVARLGLRRFAVIGTSMGGLIAMALMRAMPERICGTVLNDVGPQVGQAGLARIAAYVANPQPFADWAAAAAAIARAQAESFPDLSGDDWTAFVRRTFRELPDGRVIADYDPAIAAAMSGAKPGFALRFAMWRLFGSLKRAPLLIIRGQLSDILEASTAERMKRRHTTSTLTTIPRVGHAPLLDEPASIAALTDFLRLVDPGRG